MDPIEKLLSELAPVRSPSTLDLTMEREFRRAETRVRHKRTIRTLSTACVFLMMGTGIGFQLGRSSEEQDALPLVPQDAKNETPVVRERPIFDFTTTATWPQGPREAHYAPPPPGLAADGSV